MMCCVYTQIGVSYPSCLAFSGKVHFSFLDRHHIPPLDECKPSLLNRLRPAFPRNCRTPSNPGFRYRARVTGKRFSRMIWNGIGRRGGFLMGSGEGLRMKTANPPTPLIRGAFSRRGGALMERGWTMKMKIILFSENIDKFTGFFDKFLKNNIQINDCNQKGCHINLSVSHSDMAAKKVFWFPRICPQLPVFARGAIPPSPRLLSRQSGAAPA